jgi:PAS domain S-box-containing protein
MPQPISVPHVSEAGQVIPGAERICAGVQGAAAAVGLLIGLSNLAVWFSEPAQSAASLHGLMIMRANTAIAITAAALSLGLWQAAASRAMGVHLARMFGLLAALIGGLTAWEDLAGGDFGLDQMLIAGTFLGDRAGAFTVHPGRMSLNAALSLFFLGGALGGMDWSVELRGRRRFFPAPACALFAALPAMCGLVGYLLGSRDFTGLLRSTNILLHTAVALFVLSMGVLAARPHRPPVARILSSGPDGVLLRWLLPGSTVLLLTLAWTISQGSAAGLVAPGEGTALMLYGGLVLLFLLIVAASKAVGGQEANARRAHTALREEERRSRGILETSLDGVLLMDAAGQVVDWNPAAERIFGWQRSEVIGRPLAECIIPEAQRAAHYRGLARYLETGEANVLGRRLELSALRRSGEEFPVELSINALVGADRPLFVGFIRDITERKQNEAALRAAMDRAEAGALAIAESAERFRLLSEVVALQVWTARPDGELDYANHETAKYFGADLERDILGSGWTQFVHADDRPIAQSTWYSAIATGSRYEVEFRLRRRDGEFRWFLVRAEAMRNGEGQIVRWFGTNTEIHDLKTAQSEAERASRAKDAFLAALSHELRTPLTPVLMTAAELREDERLPLDVREQLGMVERNIGLEARLIDDLLDLTRIARGKLLLRTQKCDAHSLIGLALEIVRDEALTKGITLEREFAAAHSGLDADPARIQQVIWNLLRNAVKFTPRGGHIAIRTRDESDGRLHIEVADSGIGIDPGDLGHIFLPFEQGEHGGEHRFGGVGLGLAIARAIVESHGGTIAAQSGGANLGATFTVELPDAGEPPPGAFDAARADSGASPEGASGSDRSSLRLLVVEDHDPTLRVLSRLLTRDGHRVVTAKSISDALAAGAAGTFDLVISDLGLPDGTGHELMETLRKEYGLRGIALSGYGMEDDIERSRQSGFVTHLIKPVDFTQLRRVIAGLV